MAGVADLERGAGEPTSSATKQNSVLSQKGTDATCTAAPDHASPSVRPDSALFNPNTPKIELGVTNLSHSVSIKSGGLCRRTQKPILHSINATFRSGELCALMGPSGAGKTTLLSVLSAGRNPALTLNSHRVPKSFSSLSCTIPQADILLPALTPAQALYYSALLRLPQSTSKQRLNEIVDKLLTELMLTNCRNTPVGSENVRGVSGGERKRVSIGTELVTNPSILFVDEPTSGLDSKMAEDTIRLLKRLAANGKLVICTIHQPSWSIFEQFDRLLLLHHGRVVYNGAGTEHLRNYFSSIGYEPPAFENPLDYYMRELQSQPEDLFFPNKWTAAKLQGRSIADVDSVSFSQELTASQLRTLRAHNSHWHQFQVLLRRSFHDTFADKEKFLTKVGMKLGTGVLIGLIFINQGRRDAPSAIFTTSSPLFFLVLTAGFDTTMEAILLYPNMRPLIAREYANGAFSFEAFFASQIISSLTVDIISSLFYLPLYPMVGLGPSAAQFFTFVAAIALITAIGGAIGLAVGARAKDIKEAEAYIMPTLIPLLIFSGFMLPKDDIPFYFEWLYWVSPFQYALSITFINEFEDRVYSDGSTGLEYLATNQLSPDQLGRDFAVLAGMLVPLEILVYFVSRSAIRTAAQRS